MSVTFERTEIRPGRWDRATCEACGEEEATVLIFETPIDICTSKVLVICSRCDYIAEDILEDKVLDVARA